MSLETRDVIHFFWRKSTSNQASLSKRQRVYNTNVPTLRTIQNRTADFANGRTELADLPRPGRPRGPINVDAVRDLIESERFLSQKQIGHMLGPHSDTVNRISREARRCAKMNCRWISHAIESSEKVARVQVAKDLLQFLEGTSNQKLCNVYTGDEMWVSMDNPRMSMWIRADVARPTVLQPTIGTKKCMFWIEFSGTATGVVAMLPSGSYFIQNFFVDNVLPDVTDDRVFSCPKLKSNETVLHLDNPGPHLRNGEFEELGIRRLPHPHTVRIRFRATSGDSAILSNVSRDNHSTIPWHCRRRCQKF
jgi:hypothetical protein